MLSTHIILCTTVCYQANVQCFSLSSIYHFQSHTNEQNECVQTKGNSTLNNCIFYVFLIFSPTSSQRVCIATASPAKFEEVVLSTGLTPQPTEGVKALAGMPTKYVDMMKGEDWDKVLREKIASITSLREK